MVVRRGRRGGNVPFGDFTSILINPRNGDEVFAGNAYQTSEVGGGVFRTTDGGQTWARIDPKGRRLPSQRIWALAFDAHDQNVLFVGSHSAGVYVVPRMTDAVSSLNNLSLKHFRFVTLKRSQSHRNVFCCLDIAHTGVYIAALPGKKAAGVCRTKRGNYGRAVIETD